MNIGCGIKYKFVRHSKGNYVGIYQLNVHKLLRGRRLASLLLNTVITEIRLKFGENIPILIVALPYGNDGMNKEQLTAFYKRYNLKIVKNWPT